MNFTPNGSDTKDDLDDISSLLGLCGGEQRAGPMTGTKALMLALLQDGVRAYLSRNSRDRFEAEAWMLSRRRTVFSFDVVCETLGLEPSWVRAVLKHLRERNVSARSLHRLRPNVRHTGRLDRTRKKSG
jgi:hypothetical protein